MDNYKPLPHQDPSLDSDLPPVLIVDDESAILEVLEDFLTVHGYAVETTADPEKALDFIKNRRYCTIIADHFMPKMEGLDLLCAAAKIQPRATRILLTGHASMEVVVEAINKGEVFRFLCKPWEDGDLLNALRNAISRFQLLEENASLQVETQKLNERLEQANAALNENFRQSISLCHNLMSTFYPLLGRYTRGVEDICKRLCEEDLFTEEEENVLMLSASLHNIGLIGIPRDVLATAFRHPSALSAYHRELVEKHPVYGASLAAFVGRLKGVAETIRAHHERWDGKGYPDGLKENAIPRTARFLAVAAAYVECGLSHEEASQYILDESDKAFFPEAVRALLKVSHAFKLPKQIREITVRELRSGMVLAKSLHSPSGLLLVPEGQILRSDTLAKLHNHDILDHVRDRLLIYV